MQVTSIYATGGALGVDSAIKVMMGKPVPKRIISETPIITPENVKEYYSKEDQYVR